MLLALGGHGPRGVGDGIVLGLQRLQEEDWRRAPVLALHAGLHGPALVRGVGHLQALGVGAAHRAGERQHLAQMRGDGEESHEKKTIWLVVRVNCGGFFLHFLE